MFFNTYPFGIMQHSENKRKTDTYVLKNEWPFKLMIDTQKRRESITENSKSESKRRHTDRHTHIYKIGIITHEKKLSRGMR
jgi:hypothetical protein